jgi:hypothetical protein
MPLNIMDSCTAALTTILQRTMCYRRWLMNQIVHS